MAALFGEFSVVSVSGGGAFGKVGGNNARKSLGTKGYWCGKCVKEEFPGKSWENVLLVWSKMRVCSQEQNAQVSGNQGLLGNKRHDWAEAPPGTKPDFAGFEISSVASLTMSRIAMEGGGGEIQPQSSDLHNSCENHPAIMQARQAQFEKRTLESTGHGRGG